jgi:hypothetical protein
MVVFGAQDSMLRFWVEVVVLARNIRAVVAVKLVALPLQHGALVACLGCFVMAPVASEAPSARLAVPLRGLLQMSCGGTDGTCLAGCMRHA